MSIFDKKASPESADSYRAAQPPAPLPAQRESVVEKAHEVADVGREAAKDVAVTAKQEVQSVAAEVGTQAHRVASDARTRLREQATEQQHHLAMRLGTISDELRSMAANHPDTPARTLVDQLADKSSVLADYLDQRSPEEVLDEVQTFARRRPGTFIATAAAAGFVVGRLGKGVWQAQKDGSS